MKLHFTAGWRVRSSDPLFLLFVPNHERRVYCHWLPLGCSSPTIDCPRAVTGCQTLREALEGGRWGKGDGRKGSLERNHCPEGPSERRRTNGSTLSLTVISKDIFLAKFY